MSNSEVELLTAREVCATLKGIGVSTLLRMASHGAVKSYVVGHRGRRFILREVLQDLARGRGEKPRPPAA